MNFNFADLVGKTLLEARVTDDQSSMYFTTTEGQVLEMTHYQDCCESVYVDEIVGDLNDLIGATLLRAEESTNSDQAKSEYAESFTWTFYKLATKKGYVDIKWYGTSNGYYSESVSTSVVNTLSPEELNKLKESILDPKEQFAQQSKEEFANLENSKKTTTRFKF